MQVYTYKSLKIIEFSNGEKEISGLSGRDIISEVIPDAVEFVKVSESEGGVKLSNLNGIDLYVFPFSIPNKLVNEWMEEKFRLSGIDF